MALRSRLNFLPRIYCLTLPGTTRQKEMAARLNSCELPWEFVYGDDRPPDKDIPWDYVNKSEWSDAFDKNLNSRYLNGVAGCKTGVIRVMKKALDDGDQGFIFCNDDVLLADQFRYAALEIINQLPKDVGMLGMCYHIGPDHITDAGPYFFECSGRYRMEWMCFIRRWFAKPYIHALETEGCESDVSIERYLKKNKQKIYLTKLQLAKLSSEANNSIIGYGVQVKGPDDEELPTLYKQI